MEIVSRTPIYQAYTLLRAAFVILPILAGVDKFFNYIVNWGQYLEPLLGGMGHGFLMGLGIVEIILGIGVIIKPRVFSYLIALWLALIIVNLVTLATLQSDGGKSGYKLLAPGTYYDIALRDFGLFLASLAMGRLAKVF